VDARVVDEGAANDKSVGKVETRHGCELIDIAAADPDALSIVLADGVMEAKRFWQKTWWHTRVEAENEECSEVAQSDGTSSDSESSMIRGGIIIP
jgi:hypothetical protein